MLNLLYDAFELQRMGEYNASQDDGSPPEIFCEPIFDPILEDDEEALRTFWVIQGHLPTGGVDTLIEIETLKEAEKIYDFLCLLLATHKKYNKMVDIIIGD